MAKIISVINYKGGVGKTTSAFNISISLKRIYEFLNNISNNYVYKLQNSYNDYVNTYGLNYHGFANSIIPKLSNGRILVIDLDPQSSLSKLCMKRVCTNLGVSELQLSDLNNIETINFVFKSYLQSKDLGINPTFNLQNLIKTNYYGIEFIPSTMFYNNRIEGLDNLEIELARNNNNQLYNLTILSKFIKDNGLDEIYDFIIFDCPPANNIITQNALLMSDYYLIPSIMDDMSSNGIPHLHNLIQNSIIKYVNDNYGDFIQVNGNANYLKFLKNDASLIGIFETIRDTRAKYNQNEIKLDLSRNFKVFREIIGDYNDIPKQMGEGIACIDINFNGKVIDCGISYLMIAYHILKDA